MSAAWLTGNLLTFDTETTAPNPLEARIVQASVIEVGREGVARRETWLVNPGVPIPPEATAIHGITDVMAAGGLEPVMVVPQITELLREGWERGCAVVAMNASYDLTVLREECRRIDHDGCELGPVLDPLVIDRGCFPFRAGKRTLTALAAFYGVRLDGAHSSDGDALAAARVVWAQAKRCTAIRDLTLAEMQRWQADAHRAWATNFQEYLRRSGKPDAVIETEWPIRKEAA